MEPGAVPLSESELEAKEVKEEVSQAVQLEEELPTAALPAEKSKHLSTFQKVP